MDEVEEVVNSRDLLLPAVDEEIGGEEEVGGPVLSTPNGAPREAAAAESREDGEAAKVNLLLHIVSVVSQLEKVVEAMQEQLEGERPVWSLHQATCRDGRDAQCPLRNRMALQ